jgi:hypothetical protein
MYIFDYKKVASTPTISEQISKFRMFLQAENTADTKIYAVYVDDANDILKIIDVCKTYITRKCIIIGGVESWIVILKI